MELHGFAKPIPGGAGTSLWCHVTDYDLSGVTIQFTVDRAPLNHGVNVTGPLPNGDGTVQIRLKVEITLDSSKTYRCEAHSKTTDQSVVFGKTNIVACKVN